MWRRAVGYKFADNSEESTDSIFRIKDADSTGFLRWCITHRINWFSDFVHRPDSKELEDKNTTFRKLDLFPSSGEGRHLLLVQWLRLTLSKGPNRVCVSPHLRTETDPVSETSCLTSDSLESGRWTKSENPLIIYLRCGLQAKSKLSDLLAYFSLWRRTQYIPPKRRSHSGTLDLIFIVTAISISNPACVGTR
jgi:hypothetical protein